jgi:hypothetical protein
MTRVLIRREGALGRLTLTKAIISFWTELPLCGIIRTWQGGVAVHSRKNGFMRSD